MDKKKMTNNFVLTLFAVIITAALALKIFRPESGLPPHTNGFSSSSPLVVSSPNAPDATYDTREKNQPPSQREIFLHEKTSLPVSARSFIGGEGEGILTIYAKLPEILQTHDYGVWLYGKSLHEYKKLGNFYKDLDTKEYIFTGLLDEKDFSLDRVIIALTRAGESLDLGTILFEGDL